jgi:hypothetical protein
MIVESTEQLRGWLREHGYDALAELPSFDVPQEEYEKHLADIRAQHLHGDEGSLRARAVYRCLTTHLGAPDKRPAAQDSMATHLDRAARVFNQSVAVLAGKTEAHAKAVEQARDEILKDSAEQHDWDRSIGRDACEASERAREEIRALVSLTQALAETRWRQTLWIIVLGFALVLGLLGFSIVARGQDAPPWAKSETKPATVKPAEPKAELTIPDSLKVKLLRLEVEQNDLLIQMQNAQIKIDGLQLQIEKAKAQLATYDHEIQKAVTEQAARDRVDLKKWTFDLRTMGWKPKEK